MILSFALKQLPHFSRFIFRGSCIAFNSTQSVSVSYFFISCFFGKYEFGTILIHPHEKVVLFYLVHKVTCNVLVLNSLQECNFMLLLVVFPIRVLLILHMSCIQPPLFLNDIKQLKSHVLLRGVIIDISTYQEASALAKITYSSLRLYKRIKMSSVKTDNISRCHFLHPERR